MAVALVALFVALGGSSYAVFVPAGSVGTKAIKNNSVRTKDIRNRTIRGKDIHRRTVRGGNVARRTLSGGNLVRNRVTGTEIRESTLAVVPSAENANTANNATALQGLGPNAFVPAGKFVSTGSAKKISSGKSATLFTSGPFTVSASCVPGAGSNLSVSVTLKSSEANSSLQDTQGTTETFVSTGPNPGHEQDSTPVGLAAPSGRTLDLLLQSGVHGIGANCWVSGFGFS
jgi:hypothetical protein